MNDWNLRTIEEFRAHKGQVGGVWEGKPLLLLTTNGARTGQPHTTPVMYLREGAHIYIFASKNGAPTNPAWYHNLLAHPEVRIELGDQTYTAVAAPVTGEERDQIYTRWAEQYPRFREYQTKTTRIIPVIELEQRSA